MSELITVSNLDFVIDQNRDIKDEILDKVNKLYKNSLFLQLKDTPQLSLLILQQFGLIQMPIDDKFWSGAIYVKDGKVIPVINTALPRVNQYFVAWHEIYHLMFDNISFNHFIKVDHTLEERKAEYFSACMLLDGIDEFYMELLGTDFISKVLHCMSAFQAPYKAVLVSLYEFATHSNNDKMKKQIKEVFDLSLQDLPERFQALGLDDGILKPSYVVNTTELQKRIEISKGENPELNHHVINEEFLNTIMKEIAMIARSDI